MIISVRHKWPPLSLSEMFSFCHFAMFQSILKHHWGGKALVHVQNKCQIQLCSVWWIREENSRVWQWLWWWQSHVWLQSIPARDSRPQIYLGQGVVEKPQDFLYLSIIPLIFFNYSVPSAQESKRKSVNCWKIWFSEVHRKLLEVRGSKSDAVMGVRVLQWT